MRLFFTLLFFVVVCPLISFATDSNKKTTHVISPDSSECYAAQNVTVCGKVYGYYYSSQINGYPTFLDMGACYPNSTFTVLVQGKDLPNFNFDLQLLVDHDVCFTGTITVYNDKPEMFVTNPDQVTVRVRGNRSVARGN